MTPSEVLGLVIGGLALLVTVGVGVFAIWQAREYARDAKASTDEAGRIQRDVAVSVRALETNIQILRGILGSQIDRLTARMIELPSSHEPFLELLKLTITDQRSLPSPATTPSANVKELRRELLRAAVAAARYAGQLNVTTRHVARDVEESGRILQVDGEPLAPIFNDILVDTARAFNGYLKHIDGYTPDEMREAGVQKQVQLLQHNFPAVGTTL